MKSIAAFLKREPVLAAAALAALISCFFVPPDRGYLDYPDLRTLALLYCLMTVVAGLRDAGLFDRLAHGLCGRAGSVRRLGTMLVLLSFFSAMLITNDVALLTFVPFAAVTLGMARREKALCRVVVLQTAAANLGSMLTPVGNPQNLYLYNHYKYGIGGFLKETLPFWALSLVLIAAACLLLDRAHVSAVPTEAPPLDRRALGLHLALFALCLLTVMKLLPWGALLGLTLAILLVFDRKRLLKADFMLLLTFLAFFVFAGNLARIPAASALLRRLLDKRAYLTALLASQVISNVPAAVLLAPFSRNWQGLLLGVDIGGLGTPVASLASLITIKFYLNSRQPQSGRFMGLFLAANGLGLVLLLAAARLLY